MSVLYCWLLELREDLLSPDAKASHLVLSEMDQTIFKRERKRCHEVIKGTKKVNLVSVKVFWRVIAFSMSAILRGKGEKLLSSSPTSAVKVTRVLIGFSSELP